MADKSDFQNRSPKTLFQLNSLEADWLADIVATPRFQHAAAMAFAEYCRSLPRGDSVQQSWDSNNRRVGAQEFLNALLTLPYAVTVPPQRSHQNLDPLP